MKYAASILALAIGLNFALPLAGFELVAPAKALADSGHGGGNSGSGSDHSGSGGGHGGDDNGDDGDDDDNGGNSPDDDGTADQGGGNDDDSTFHKMKKAKSHS